MVVTWPSAPATATGFLDIIDCLSSFVLFHGRLSVLLFLTLLLCCRTATDKIQSVTIWTPAKIQIFIFGSFPFLGDLSARPMI
jgi:hypothetical protein